MKKIIAITLFQIVCYCSFSQNISLQIVTPQNNIVTDSLLSISAFVKSTYEIAGVTAIAGNIQDSLLYNQNDGYFEATLNVKTFPKGDTIPLIFTAKDVFNNSVSDTVSFIYAPHPTLQIFYPLAGSNSNDPMHIKATCSGVGPCKLVVYFGGMVDTFLNSVDTLVNPPHTGVDFTAIDHWGQTASGGVNTFFDNNILLKQIYSGSGYVYDFNYNKVLVQDAAIVDINTLQSTTIRRNGGGDEGNSFLTPYGAVFGNGTGTYGGIAYDWNNDSLYQLSNGLASAVVHTAGKYATWLDADIPQDGDPLLTYVYLRNLETRTNTLVGLSGGNDDVDTEPIGLNSYDADNTVDSTGKVTYVSGGNIVGITYDGINNYNPSDAFYFQPITDGYNIAFCKRTPNPDNGSLDFNLYLYNNQTPSLKMIGTIYQVPYQGGFINHPQPGPNYQVNNKYVAYTKVGTTGQWEVWLMDSTGNSKQLTFYSTNSTLDVLAPNGNLVYDYNNERYLVTNGSAQPKDIGATAGQLCYRDSSWYIMEGRYVYKLLVAAFISVKDGDWNDPSTWNNNIVPPADADVIVENNVTVSSNETCNSLKIISPGNMTVETGFNLMILH
jgi:hypothetical protein